MRDLELKRSFLTIQIEVKSLRWFLLDRGGLKPRHRVLVRHGRRERHRHSGEATWRQRQRPGGGGHQPRDGGPEPLEAGRGREDPPLETPQGQSLALGHHDNLRTISRAGGGWMSVDFNPPHWGP